MSDPQSFSLVVIVMGRFINCVSCRVADVTLLDAPLRAHLFNEMTWRIRTTAFSQFGLEKASVNNDKFSINMMRRS
jgi:hypothetical protein